MNTAKDNKMSVLNKFMLYVNDMALSHLSSDEFVDYINRKNSADAELESLMGQVRDAEAFRLRWNECDKELARLQTIEAAAREYVESGTYSAELYDALSAALKGEE
jgi:hypothetical protein